MSPYREPQTPRVQPSPRPTTWWRRLWYGDDGYDYAVITEPSIFRTAESQLVGPYRTKRAAFRYARLFVKCEPCGEARVVQLRPGAPWPPRTNWSDEPDWHKRVITIAEVA